MPWMRLRSLRRNRRAEGIYKQRKETIEYSFAEAKVNHGLRFIRMLDIRNMREQCFLTVSVQNIKRLAASWFFAFFPFCYNNTPPSVD